MNKANLISKLDKFCPDWLTRPLESDSEIEILQNVINQVLPRLLDIKIEFMDNSSIIGTVPYKHETANVVGYMHGGTIFSTGDTGDTPEKLFASCFRVRVFERFFNWFGIIETRWQGEKYYEPLLVKKTDLLDAIIDAPIFKRE